MKFTRIFALLFIPFLCAGCGPLRAVKWWQPDLADSSKFNNTTIAKSDAQFRFIPALHQAKYQQLTKNLDSILQNTNTNAFVVIKNDSIIYENYAENIDQHTLHPSFSVAKSYTGTLIGIAVDKGMIKSTSEPVTNYLPELAKVDPTFSRLTIQHLLDMKAGFDFDDDRESPFAPIAKLYYGTSANRLFSTLKFAKEPGKSFEYQSINTQMLGAILEKASGEKLSTLLEKYLWKPLGAESDALWSTDDRKMVKAFCCLNATAYDFAKLGRLYLHLGNWQGKQLVSKNWVKTTTDPDTLFKNGYKNQWWASARSAVAKDSLTAVQMQQKMNLHTRIRKANNGMYYFSQKSNDYRAEGILGQIVYVNPDNNVIIVRTGSYPKKNIYFNGFIPQLGREL